jgi:guanyl-specific ribonuclease Sa
MRRRFKDALVYVLTTLLAISCVCLAGCSASTVTTRDSSTASGSSVAQSSFAVDEQSAYTSKDEVALYIHTYGKLPANFISKTKAHRAGWDASEGNLADVCPGMSIGGSTFHNDDGVLPDAPKRTWKECDINYSTGFRGPERIVYSNDGLIFYTSNHYQTFEQLY